MNLDKARDFFSDYYEGALEDGLRSAFEAALANDPEIAFEYRSFERTMKALEGLKAPVTEAPSDLHERIQARLNERMGSQSRPAEIIVLWKRVALSGLAAAAIIGAILTYSHRTSASTSTAGLTPTVEIQPTRSAPRIDVRVTPSGAMLSISSDEGGTVRLSSLADGKALREIRRRPNETTETPLSNDGAKAVVLSVSLVEQDVVRYVAIPGRETDPAGTGSGSVADFAAAIANTLHKIVVLRTSDPSRKADWTLSKEDSDGQIRDAASKAGLVYEPSDSVLGLADR